MMPIYTYYLLTSKQAYLNFTVHRKPWCSQNFPEKKIGES